MGDEAVDAALLGFGFAWCEGLVVDCNQPAEGAIGCLNDVLFPEVTAGASGALLGNVEVVWPRFSSSDFIRGYLLDQAGLLWPCGGGEQSQGEGDSYPLRGPGDVTALICFHRGAVGTECQFVMLAAFYDGGFVRDQLALAGERLDLSELSAGGGFGEGCGDGRRQCGGVDLLLYLKDIAGCAEGDVFAALGSD